MDFGKRSKVAPATAPPPHHPVGMQRRKSLIEDYYAWRQNEFDAALRDAAKKEALHKTPPASPVYSRKVAKIDGKTYEKHQRKKLLMEVGDDSLDIFKPHKKKKFAMYPVVPHTPDDTPCMSPNVSSASLASSHHHHHSSFPHLPEIEESEHEDDDTPTKPMVFNFKSNSSLNKSTRKDSKSELERLMARKQLPNDPNNPDERQVTRKKSASAASSSARRANEKRIQEIDVERNTVKEMKYSKWEIAQEFVPWVMIVTSVIQVGLFLILIFLASAPWWLQLNGFYLQIALFIADRDEFFQLLVFAPKHVFELWRFVTYIFLHQNFTHLLLNVMIQVSGGSLRNVLLMFI